MLLRKGNCSARRCYGFVFLLPTLFLAGMTGCFPKAASPTVKSAPASLISYQQLVQAIYQDDAPKLHHLIENGIDVNATDVMGFTALMVAVRNNKMVCVEQLLRDKANPNLQNSAGETALVQAVRYGNVRTVPLLLKHHASVGLKMKRGLTLLKFARQIADRSPDGPQIVALLKKAGAPE